MHIRRLRTGLEVWTPAKVNLFLEVLAKRSDGFHEIETLMCPVTLYDTLTIRDDPSGRIALAGRWGPGGGNRENGGLPRQADNLVVRALDVLRCESGRRLGATVQLHKRIPVAAGLGGGSSDAAAALLAGNRLWRIAIPRPRLLELASSLGSDVPFFFNRCAAVCYGRGERVVPVTNLPTLSLVLVCPPQGLRTADVYQQSVPAERPRSSATMIDLLRKGHVERAMTSTVNRLQAAAEHLSPWVVRLSEMFSSMDVLGHQMSGSGTSYFGVCRNRRHARRVTAQLRAMDVGSVFAIRSCP